MIGNECFLCNGPNIGLSLNEERSYIKCYLGDTSLLFAHAFDENYISDVNIYSSIMHAKLSIEKRMFMENIIGQMLVANEHKLYFYNHYSEDTKRNDIEIDFIINSGNKLTNKIISTKVKSSKNNITTSLIKFFNKFKKRIFKSYIIYPKNLLIRDDGIICIPCYMTFCL